MGQTILVPKRLREEMLEILHKEHLGTNRTRMKARDVLLWPSMAAEITEKIHQCQVYLEYQLCQQSEILKSRQIPPLPWVNFSTELLRKKGRNYLVTIDYYYKWPKLTLLNSMTSTAVITESQFDRFCVSSALMSDNGSCYSSEQFKQFFQDWCFDHVTASPGYPRCNGQSERSITTLKGMLEKTDDPYKALLGYRNTLLRLMEWICYSWVDV